LYEAYIARGDTALADKQYDPALSDYEEAAALAEQDPASVLRMYEAYIRVGDALAAQKAYEPAVLMYRKAVTIGDLEARATDDETMAAVLQKAVEAADAGNFTLAFEQYRLLFVGADATQATITHVVQPGEYLILMAARYHSTVSAILHSNNLSNARLIAEGQELVIPVEP